MPLKLPGDYQDRVKAAKTRNRNEPGKPEKPARERVNKHRPTRAEGLALLDWKNEKREVTAEEVYKLAQVGLTYEEMGRWFGVTKASIYERISRNMDLLQAYERGYAELAMSLKRAVIKNAIENENATSQIWATKNVCDWRDDPRAAINESDTKQAMPEWLEKELRESGNTTPSQASANSTPTSDPGSKDSRVQ